jgi:PAS domain S-box-containing protein
MEDKSDLSRSPPEDTVAESLAHYRQMAEFSLDGIVITDLEGRILIANPAILEMLELDSTTAAQPLTIFDFLAPESFEEGKCAFFAMREGRRGVLRTYHLSSARKNLRQIEVVGNRIIYDGYPATILSARDITERLAIEAALKTSERKFELLANTSIDIINYHDSDLILTYVSPAVRSILGFETEEIVGKCILDLAYPGDKGFLQETHNALVSGERDVATLEYRMLHRDGHAVWLESTVHAITDPAGGGVKEFYNITRDISPRKTAEEIAHRRDRVLHGFATASGFLLTGRIREPIPRVLETIGEAMGADVAYVYEDALEGTGGSHTAVRRYRWARETTRSSLHRTGTCGEGHRFPGEWSNRLASGVWISGCMSRFIGADREVLEDLGIHAILLVPVFVHETYWGFIGVSDLSVDRIWADTEIEILMTLAATIGLVIEQRPAVLESRPGLEN